jgi:hypothetical protein
MREMGRPGFASIVAIIGAVLLATLAGCGAAGTPSVATTSLSDGQVNAAYSQTLSASGGSGTYTWSMISGFLPDGLSLSSSTGVISGTPTYADNYSITVLVIDSKGKSASKNLSITILAGPVSITTTSLPIGEVGAWYSAPPLEASGGDGSSYTWSISKGSLPDGLTLDSSTGNIGIGDFPTTAGTYSFTVQATSGGKTGSRDLSIAVLSAVKITTTSLPDGQVSVAYTQTLTASGGRGPYTWSATGTLPDGLSLNSSTGVISGTPTASGYYVVGVTVTDSLGGTSSDILDITIA